MLSVQALHKSYGGVRARVVLHDVSFSVERGEFIAIMGESGTGKSTLLNLIAGLDTADSGTIVFDGIDVAALNDSARTRLRRERIGFVFQAFHLLPHLSVAQNVRLPLDLANTPLREADERTRFMLDSLGIGTLAHDYPRALSGGEAQRVAIARALVHGPDLVLADEPTGNLDAQSATQVLGVLKDRIKQHAGAGVLVTHSHAAARTADRVYVLGADGLRSGSA